MYGLMRAGICSRHPDAAYQRRLHYCGTCKTMGRLYGQKSRFLLNHDAVFLAELLTALTPDAPPVPDWDASFQSYNCFALPAGSEEMPVALQVAATATLVMSEFKVADQLDDGGQGKWRLAQRIYSQSFYEASRRLKEWGFPLDAMWEWYRQQGPREKEAQDGAETRGALQTLEYVAEPTAVVTGWTFQHGAAVAGSSPETQQAMYELGFAFGQMVYTLDAWDDYEKDTKQGEFNALQAAFGLPGRAIEAEPGNALRLPDATRATVQTYLQERAAKVVAALHSLPLPEGQGALFAARLQSNLSRRLGLESCGSKPPRSLPQRLLRALGQLFRLRLAHPAYALPGSPDTTLAHLSKENRPQGGIPSSSSSPVRQRRVVRVGGPSCFCCWDGCDGCECACCCCEACGEGGCDACCSGCDCCSSCDCGSCCG